MDITHGPGLSNYKINYFLYLDISMLCHALQPWKMVHNFLVWIEINSIFVLTFSMQGVCYFQIVIKMLQFHLWNLSSYVWESVSSPPSFKNVLGEIIKLKELLILPCLWYLGNVGFPPSNSLVCVNTNKTKSVFLSVFLACDYPG